jgi:hypothetical protein
MRWKEEGWVVAGSGGGEGEGSVNGRLEGGKTEAIEHWETRQKFGSMINTMTARTRRVTKKLSSDGFFAT